MDILLSGRLIKWLSGCAQKASTRAFARSSLVRASPCISLADPNLLCTITEQEITGDVLLELDANVLKTEIGIVAFGKRARIVNAIAELRRPPSIFESPSHTPARVTTPRSQTGQSLPYSHSHSASMQSSAPTQASSGWAYSPMYPPPGYQGSPVAASPVAETNLHASDGAHRNGWPIPEGEVPPQAETNGTDAQAVGLGLGFAQAMKDGVSCYSVNQFFCSHCSCLHCRSGLLTWCCHQAMVPLRLQLSEGTSVVLEKKTVAP